MRERSRIKYWVALLAMIALTAFYAHERDIHGQYLNYQRSKAELSQLRQEVKERKEKEAKARRRLEMLRSDDVEREATVRRNKNLLRAGERIFRIEPESADSQASFSEALSGNDAIVQSEALTTRERD